MKHSINVIYLDFLLRQVKLMYKKDTKYFLTWGWGETGVLSLHFQNEPDAFLIKYGVWK